MYHTAPPPPPPPMYYGPPSHHGPPPLPPPPPLNHSHDHWHAQSHTPRPYPTTPASPHYPPPYTTSHPNSHQPRQIATTPQTPHFPSTPHSHGYPPTPTTPHYPSRSHQSPTTPHSAHASSSRTYYPSPPPHRYQHHAAGPSRPIQHHHYPHAGPSNPPQLVYRSTNPPHQHYPHSAPPRIMQSWAHTHDQSPTGPSPTASRNGHGTGIEKDILHEFLDMGDHPSEPQGPAPLYHQQPVRSLNIVEWGPDSGRQGDEVTVSIEADYPPDTHEDMERGVPGRAFRLVVGTTLVETQVSVVTSRIPKSPSATFLVLVAKLPPLHMTGQTTKTDRAPIYVECVRGMEVVDSALVGAFIYSLSHRLVSPTDQNYQSTQSVAGIKRSGEQLEQQGLRPWGGEAHRRVVSGGARLEGQHQHQSHPYSTADSMALSQQDQNQSHNPMQPSYPTQEVGSPLVEWSEKPPILTSAGLLPSVMEPAPATPVLPPIPPNCQPSLIRSSQMPAMSRGSSWYERLKAEIVFQNDLLAMTKAWTAEEWANKRRLVKVWRRQHESQIFMAFRPVSLEEYPLEKGAVIVSCIFRDDKNSCFITSVDIIYLLEAVIGQRFTIEEKNRIRRNLEGFKPQTCSKTKQGSEAFFKQVMAFGEPKPRNIEKDLKVFQWDILPAAVQKIISKYTAHYQPSSENLVAQGASPAMLAMNQLPAEFLPQPSGGFYQPPSTAQPPVQSEAQAPDAPTNDADVGPWRPSQDQPYDSSLVDPQVQTQAQTRTQADDPTASANPMSQTALQALGQGQGLGLLVSMPSANHSRQSSGMAMGPDHQQPAPQAQVDTYSSTAHTNDQSQFFAAPYSPTPQMTHSSSSNMVQSEHVTSPDDLSHSLQNQQQSQYHQNLNQSHNQNQDGSLVDSRPNTTSYAFNDTQQQQPYAIPNHDDQFWPTDGIQAYSMGGANTYDNGGMYDNMLVKPLDVDDLADFGNVVQAAGGGGGGGEVRGMYTAHST